MVCRHVCAQIYGVQRYTRENGVSRAMLFPMSILYLEEKSGFESHISGGIKGKSEKHWALTATLRKSSNKIIMKAHEQSIFWCTIFHPFKHILLLPSPAAWVALYHTIFSSQLFYFMIAIKTHSNPGEVSGDRAGDSCLTKHCPCD